MAKRKSPNLPAVIGTKNSIVMAGGREMRMDRAYSVPEVHPSSDGPWADEHDKLAWTDPATGLGCIVLRSPVDGSLGGYVGVDLGHPVFGFTAEALSQGFDIVVHGGLDHAALCQPGREERTVCHVPTDHGSSARIRLSDVPEHHDDRWWFGFQCNQPFDLVPGTGEGRPGPDQFGADNLITRDRSYRNVAYVLGQCTSLASQLEAIGKGEEPRPTGALPPPLGLVPGRSGHGS